MKRVGDWELALYEYVVSVDGEPFEYGTRDCLMFAGGAVSAMTGEDPVADYRGTYSTDIGASKLLHKLADGTVEGLLDLNLPTIPIGFARRGDLALSDGSVGIVMGGFAIFIGELEPEDVADPEEEEPERIRMPVEPEEPVVPALIRKPRELWEKAWAVG